MKLRVYSDLHLDWYAAWYDKKSGVDPFWYPPEMPDDKDTVLILAGDLWVGYRCIAWGETSWLGVVSQRFKQVLIVLGNHDYWQDLDIISGGRKMNEDLQDACLFNVKVLDCDSFLLENKLFVGATLWTDMDRSNPLAMVRMRDIMRPDSKIAYDHGNGRDFVRFSSQKWISTHHRHREYIQNVARQNYDKDIIVITHHLPLHKMGDPVFMGQESNAYYTSDLSDVIFDSPNIKFWCAGHSHVGNDFLFEHCRMYMNPVGYFSEHREQEELVKHEVIDV